MKIAVAAKGKGMEALVDDRFGRCEEFVIFDTETNETVTIENEAKNEAGGAGGRAVRILSQNKVEVVLVPELGPKATDALVAFEIDAYRRDESKTVEELINSYREGKLEKVEVSTVEEHAGLRRV
jgi:predicted Fe-Mo cluster-binding NifX family protein